MPRRQENTAILNIDLTGQETESCSPAAGENSPVAGECKKRERNLHGVGVWVAVMEENRDLREISEEESPPAECSPAAEQTPQDRAAENPAPKESVQAENAGGELKQSSAEQTPQSMAAENPAPEESVQAENAGEELKQGPAEETPQSMAENSAPEANAQAGDAGEEPRQSAEPASPAEQSAEPKPPQRELPHGPGTEARQTGWAGPPNGPIPSSGSIPGKGPVPGAPGYPQPTYAGPVPPYQGYGPQNRPGSAPPPNRAGQTPYFPGAGAPYAGGYQAPRGPYVPPVSGNMPRPPVPPRPTPPPNGRLSQRAIIGLVITCCVTVFLSVLVFTVGMVLTPVFEAASYSMAWGDGNQDSGSSGGWDNWNNWYDNYNSGYSYDSYGQGSGNPSASGEKEPVMEHSDEAHNAIEFLISGVAYVTGAEIDEGNDDQEYVVVSLLASNLGTEESGFRLSQITARDGEGNVLNPVFPAYSYSLGLLPDNVTLKPKYQVRGSVIFTADNSPLTLVIYEADGCEKRSIPIAPKN